MAAFNIKTDLKIQYQNVSGTWIDMLCDSYELDIDRGIEIDTGVLAKASVGTATLRMMKTSLQDMLGSGYPLYKSNMPFRVQYNPSASFVTIFTGFIQNTFMSYNMDAKKLQITVVANDAIKIALGTNIGTLTIGSGTARSYINVMNQLGSAITAIDSRFTLNHYLSGGSSTYQYDGDTFLNETSGTIFEQYVDAELGWLYCNRDGEVRYYTRADINTIQGDPFSSSNRTVSNVHSTDVLHVCMDAIDLQYDSDNLVNVVRVTNAATSLKSVSTNSTSVTDYGRQLADFTVRFNPASPSSTLANWATEVVNAANPKLIKSVSVLVINRDGNANGVLLNDIGSPLQVEFASTGLPTLQQNYIVARQHHVITPDHWTLDLDIWKGI